MKKFIDRRAVGGRTTPLNPIKFQELYNMNDRNVNTIVLYQYTIPLSQSFINNYQEDCRAYADEM
jgi:hypothetical protein